MPLRLSILLAVPLLVTGCADWERHAQSRLPAANPAFADKTIQVMPRTFVHSVGFAENSTALTAGERRALFTFLDETARFDSSAKVAVEKPPRGAARHQARRAEEVRQALAKAGYTVTFATIETASAESVVRVMVTGQEAFAPNCPNWDMHTNFTFGAQPLPNLGCADRANLAAMAADPSDLVHGRVPGGWGAAGNAALLGENRYRTGTAYAPLDSEPQTTPGTINLGNAAQ